MSIKFRVTKNWQPTRMKVRAVPQPVQSFEWWRANSLVISTGLVALYSAVKYVGNKTTTDDASWNYNSGTVASSAVTTTGATVNYISETSVQDTDPWWTLTQAAAVNNGFATAREAIVIADQAVPADIPMWNVGASDVTVESTNVAKPTTATYYQGRETPADISWWNINGTATTAAIKQTTLSTDVIYYLDQEEPAAIPWWNTVASDLVVTSTQMDVPTSVLYYQDRASPADIAWWSYAGE